MARTQPAHHLERWVHFTLLGGLLACGLLLFTGLVEAVASGETRPLGGPPPLKAVLAGALRGKSVDRIDAGLLILIATPMVRVAVLAVGWALQRQWRFAGVAALVLALLGLGLALGLA